MRLFSKIFLSLRNFDWFLLLIVLILISIGLASIYSVDLSLGGELTFFPTQILALIIGIGLVFTAGIVNVNFYRASARIFYLISFSLLFLVLFFGINIRGTTGWFRVAGFSFQPAEFAKIGLILFLAWLISRYGREFYKFKFVFSTGLFTFILAGLIVLQPDLGSALLLFFVWFGLLFLAGTKKRYIALLVGVLFIVFVFSWSFLFKDYQKERFSTFLNPELDPLGSGYNVSQSIIAVGSGNFFGRGLGFGSQSQLHFLPEAQTDFIFSVIAEELGFIGVMIVLILYFLLLWRLSYIASFLKNDFQVYTLLGIALLFFVQMVVNIGGALGMLPVTGVTLPFLSYGGSSLVINLFLIGIAQSVAKNRVIN